MGFTAGERDVALTSQIDISTWNWDLHSFIDNYKLLYFKLYREFFLQQKILISVV